MKYRGKNKSVAFTILFSVVFVVYFIECFVFPVVIIFPFCTGQIWLSLNVHYK